MLKNMKIGKKLMLTFILVTVISSIAGIVGLTQMTNMQTNYSYALTNYGFSQGDIGLLHAEFNDSRSIIRDIILSSGTDTIDTYLTQLDQANGKIDTYLASMKKSMVNEAERNSYNDISDNMDQFKTVSNQVVDLAKQNKNEQAQILLATQGVHLEEKVAISIDTLISEKTKQGNTIATNLSAQKTMATAGMTASIIVAIVLSLIIAVSIAHGISKPVKEMKMAAQEIAKGNIEVQISVKSKDEIGQLGTALAESIASIRSYIADITKTLGEIEHGNLTVVPELEYTGNYVDLKNSCDGILTYLNDTLGHINEASEQVSSGSEQVSNGAQTLAQGATEQASSIEELSASIMEISTQVKENAKHANEASINANNVRSEIGISNKHMNDMVTAMFQISESSSQISKIIKTIEDIAFQTNILALNAAVEAARAGAAGKGFAVVADEVRNLAGKSAEAAKNTAALIENSINQVKNGTKIANETAKSLLRVVASTKIVADTIDKISQASSQQADSIGQATLGVDQISSVVQTNSVTAEESAAASEELSEQAQAMKALVKRFKLRNQTGRDQNIEIEEHPQQKSEYEDSFLNNEY